MTKQIKPINQTNDSLIGAVIFHTLQNPIVSWNITRFNEILLNSIKEKEVHKPINNTISLENNEAFTSLSKQEFETNLLEIINNNPQAEKIDLSELMKDNTLRTYIYDIVWHNYPMLNISRLQEDHKLVNISFLWVKNLNDSIGKEFVDLFTDKLKVYILENFRKHKKLEEIWRIIRNSYKHLTLSQDKTSDLSEKLFAWEKSKEVIIKSILENITDNELNKVLQSSWKANLSRDDIQEKIKKVFSFWIWTSIVKKWIKNKLIAFYQWEISSRNDTNLVNLWESISFDFWKIKSHATKALEIEKNIIENHKWKKFIYDWVSFDIVVNWKISSILLKYIRKWEKLNFLDNSNIENNILEYISNLINWFDFISPTLDNDFDNIEKVNEQLKNWIVDISLLKNNYKNTLSISALNTLSEWKEWLRMFIDIVDMWIMNLEDFRDLALKVKYWKITEDNFDELLNAWNTATQKIQSLIKIVKDKYPEAILSIWWDEIFLFFPWETEKNINIVISNVCEYIWEFDLKWRLSTSFEKNNTKIFDNLDNITQVNKLVEKKYEKILHKLNKEEIFLEVWPTVTNINIDKQKFKIVNENLSYFINLLKNNLYSNLEYLIKNWNKNEFSIKYHINDINWTLKIKLEKIANIINLNIH